jgi:3-methyl-2-oxobutanoate hydroxymethyltransferase
MSQVATPTEPMTVPSFRARKSSGTPLVVLTAYDAATTVAAEGGGADAILVGDSLGMVVLGYDSTLPVTMEEMLHHARAVGRVRKRALMIADMPWLSYHVTTADAVRNAASFIRDCRADAVKVEGGTKRVPVIEAMLAAEIPVMGHVGLTPQSVLQMGGYKVQGRREEEAERLVADARALEAAGVFSIVLEGIPAQLGERITRELDIPTIGIGAGPACDGQVLVIHDMLHLFLDFTPKFAKIYADVGGITRDALESFCNEVRDGRFPAEEHCY